MGDMINMQDKWIQIWGQAHSNLSHFYYPDDEKTYRFIINSALSGKSIRIRLSNEFSNSDVFIGEITLAKCDCNGRFKDSYKTVTFNNQNDIVLKKGDRILCDETEIDILPGEFLAVSIYVRKGDLKSGNLLNNVQLITVKGNKCKEESVENQRRKRDSVIDAAGNILNLFLHKPLPLIESVEILNSSGASAITVFGDSLCQQGFWTGRFEERIRQEYPDRFSVINKSIMGNRVLRDFSPRFPCKGLFGDSAIKRLKRDVIDYVDSEYVIVAVGTNDLLQYGTIAAPKTDKPTAEELFDGIVSMTKTIQEAGKKPIVFNVAMFGECIDSRKEKEITAKKYNRLLTENQEKFYFLFDQEQVVINPVKTNCTKTEYLGKDKLHYNITGGNKVADAIDLSIFRD